MRRLTLLAVIPFALGCAQQSALRAPTPLTDEPLKVRLYAPTGGPLSYNLSEPAYVAIFAVTRGHGISLLYPYSASQAGHRSHAGLNREAVYAGSTGWGFAGGARFGHRPLFGQADAYFVIASKYPLPVEAMIQSPYLLRGLGGVDRFRASSLSEAWGALEAILVEGLPDEAWASDVYLNWRDPFAMAYLEPRPFLEYCYGGMRAFYASAFFHADPCSNALTTTTTPPVQVVAGQRREPPKKPLDRDPSVPLPPDAAIARTSRSRSEAIRGERTWGDGVSSRADIGRPVPAAREQPSAPPPSRPSEPSPAREPSREQETRPQPRPDT